MTDGSILDVPAWERALERRFPTPASKHYTTGYKAGYECQPMRPPAHSKDASRPTWMLDNADWYAKGYAHGKEDRQQDG
jgi:hypothetical protein